MSFKNIFFLGLIISTSACASNEKSYKTSDHYDGKIFYNQDPSIVPKGLGKVIRWWFSSDNNTWPENVALTLPPTVPNPESNGKLRTTFINHATFLIQLNGLNILTDPIWSARTSPVSFAGPKRVHEPGVKFENLPKINVVFISHSHYDHMDSETIERLEKTFSPQFIVPLGNKKHLEGFGAKKIIELDWWESFRINDKNVLTMTPIQHWSSRTLLDKQKALWGSFVIAGEKHSVYFAGDTGYGKHFKEISARLGKISVSLLPIGAYEPRWFMKDMHMNPEDSVLAHLDLKSEFSLGMHFGTFQLTSESIDAPLKDLEIAKLKYKLKNFGVLLPGQNQEF